jgi:hypothetical protein
VLQAPLARLDPEARVDAPHEIHGLRADVAEPMPEANDRLRGALRPAGLRGPADRRRPCRLEAPGGVVSPSAAASGGASPAIASRARILPDSCLDLWHSRDTSRRVKSVPTCLVSIIWPRSLVGQPRPFKN